MAKPPARPLDCAPTETSLYRVHQKCLYKYQNWVLSTKCFVSVYIYIYIYIYMCVCVWVCARNIKAFWLFNLCIFLNAIESRYSSIASCDAWPWRRRDYNRLKRRKLPLARRNMSKVLDLQMLKLPAQKNTSHNSGRKFPRRLDFLDFFNLEDKTDRFSGNVGTELPLHAAQNPRKVETSRR
jgi:hypothetical protein